MELVEWASQLAAARLADAKPWRWAHVRSVAAEEDRIGQAFDPDGELLQAAAILHDVGYVPDLKVTGFHPLDGARHLAALEASPRLCALVARHSCAIREADMRGLGAGVAAFTDEETPLRDALWYCDMVTGPHGERVTFEDRLAEIQARYGPQDLVSRFIQAARSDLNGAVERTLHRLQLPGLPQPR